MAIEFLRASEVQPRADVRFVINYPKRGGSKTRIHGFLYPYKDENGLNIMEVFLSAASDDPDSLKRCYREIMQHAMLYHLRTMILPVFPDSGHTGLSRKQILHAACSAYSELNSKYFIAVYLLDEEFSSEEEDILSIAKYVESIYVDPVTLEERYSLHYSADDDDDDYSADDDDVHYSADDDDLVSQSVTLESRTPMRFDPIRGIFQLDESFGETVLKLIEAKGMTEAQCYNRANISRAAFYKIRQSARDPKSTYRPTKQTAQALAIALELSIDEADDLLERAGYAFSHSNKGDIIVEYFLINKKYDIFAVNEVLYHYDQPLLGSL